MELQLPGLQYGIRGQTQPCVRRTYRSQPWGSTKLKYVTQVTRSFMHRKVCSAEGSTSLFSIHWNDADILSICTLGQEIGLPSPLQSSSGWLSVTFVKTEQMEEKPHFNQPSVPNKSDLTHSYFQYADVQLYLESCLSELLQISTGHLHFTFITLKFPFS